MIRLARLAARAASILLRLAGAGLVAFHAWLVLSMAADGRLADPAVAFRWLVAAGLAVGLVALHRAGVPIIRSRQGAALWVLVLLLHVSAFGQTPAVPVEAEADASWLFVVPATPAALGLLLGGLALVVRARTSRAAPLHRASWRLSLLLPAVYACQVSRILVPRAPPLTASPLL